MIASGDHGAEVAGTARDLRVFRLSVGPGEEPQMRYVLTVVGTLALVFAAVAAAPRQDRIPAAGGDITITAIRHATFVLQHGPVTIYVDPVGGTERFTGLPKPDIILITDIHGDHASAATVRAVRKAGTVIVCPPAVAERLGKMAGVRVLWNHESTTVRGVRITAVPMYNITPSRMRFHPKGRGNGYVVELGGKRIYISGDTEDIQEMRELKNIDAAFVCMNLPFTMTVEQAADAVLAFKPRIVYPYHYRGRGGVSDLTRFKQLVGKDPSIEVRVLDWYGG